MVDNIQKCKDEIVTRNRIQLGTFISEYSVRNKNDLNIPVYSVTNSQGFCKEYFGKEIASKDKTTYKIVPYGYFAYNPSRINVGSIDWQRCEEQVIVSPLYNVFSVSDSIDRQFLYYFLKSDIGRQIIQAKATGSVRDNLKINMLKEMTIPDICLEEQKRCANILDKLQKIIEFRKQQLNELNNLIQSRFIEMFGSGRYPTVIASEVCDFITKGTTPPTGEITEKYEIGMIPYLKVYNLSFTGELLFDNMPQYISADTHNKQLARSKVLPNDVLMNIVGPPLGKFSLVTDEFSEWNINQAIAIFRAKDRVLPRYLMAALMQPNVLRPFLEQAVGIRQLNLSLEQCRNLEFPLPPIEEQRAFVELSEQTDKSKYLFYCLEYIRNNFNAMLEFYMGG